MATYGIDYYGRAYYGAPILVQYAVRNLSAAQLNFGHVRLAWSAPVQNTWTQLALVRSQYGFPATVEDGALLATFSSTQASTSYDDLGLTPGYWYYSIFAAVPLAAWSAQLTYQAGDRVSYSAQNWIALQVVPAGTAPAAGVYWEATEQSAVWQPAGAIATMAAADHGYAALMNGYIPDSYKAAPTLSTDDQAVNDDLTDFIKVLAYGFELVGTEIDDLYHLYDTSSTRYDRLQQISQMVGISIEAASSPRYQRLRTARAAELGREKGTSQGLSDLIEAATGLGCTVSQGTNAMLHRDQSDFPFPLYPEWQTDESYEVGDLVTYQGARYQCIYWGVAPTAYTGSPNTATTGTVGSVAYYREASSAASATLTVAFTVPVTGVYVLSWDFVTSASNGVVSVALDGAAQVFVTLANSGVVQARASGFLSPPAGDSISTVDTYAAAAGYAPYYMPMSLAAGAHAITFTAGSKNASSSGYGIEVGNLTVAACWRQYPPSATVPAVSAANTGAQWSAPPAAALADYYNPQTGQVSTWSAPSPLELNVAYLGAAGLSMDVNWLTVVPGTMTAGTVYQIVSAAYPEIGTYAYTNYVPGQIVTGPDGLQYTCLVQNAVNTPPSPGFWARSAYQNPYDRELIAQSAVPIHPAPLYDPQASYTAGSMVQYNGCLFVTPSGAQGSTPPASPGSNSGWEYAGPAAARAYAASFYVPHPLTGYDTVYPGIEWYDSSGTPVVAASMMSPTGTVASNTGLPILARLIEPVADINGSYPDVGPNALSTIPAGIWEVSSGGAAVTPAYTGTTKLKFVYTDTGMANCRVGATFVTDVANSAVRDVGIVFRMADAANFFAATRSQIVLFTAGVASTLASYTRLPIGSRMLVDLSGSTIALYAYPGNAGAPTLVATVTNTALQTNTIHGLIDWTF